MVGCFDVSFVGCDLKSHKKRDFDSTVLINGVYMEFHISHYDNEGFATIELGEDALALQVLREMGAERITDYRYRLPVNRLGEFCDRRFGVERIAVRKSTVTEAQRAARRASLATVRERRWRQAT